MTVPTPLLLGHRGTPRLHPENTLQGFQAALDAGLNGAELDVRRLADGHLVVHHDLHLQDGRALSALRRQDVPPAVPTLDAVLAWAADTGAYLNVELKFETLTRSDDRVGRTLRALRAHGLGQQVIVSSFSPLMLMDALALDPGIERGLLYHRTYRLGLDLVPTVARRLRVSALHPHHSLVDAALMSDARRHGWRVNAWTVNEAAEVQRLRDLGVQGLIGDVPEVLLTARG